MTDTNGDTQTMATETKETKTATATAGASGGASKAKSDAKASATGGSGGAGAKTATAGAKGGSGGVTAAAAAADKARGKAAAPLSTRGQASSARTEELAQKRQAAIAGYTPPFLMQLHNLNQFIGASFEAYTDREPTLSQFFVLSAIASVSRPSQTDICGMSGIDRSTTAEIIKRMLARGLVERQRTAHDARAYELSLSAAGKEALALGRKANEKLQKRLAAVQGFPTTEKWIANILKEANDGAARTGSQTKTTSPAKRERERESVD